MTTQDELASLVELQPWNATFVDMLFEWWYCEADKSWAEAEAEVKRIRDPALRAWWLAEATRQMARGAKFRGRVMGRLKKLVNAPQGWIGAVVIVEGDAAPLVRQNPDGIPDAYWRHAVVTVGAEWLCRVVDCIRVEWDAEARPQYPVK